MGPFSVVVLSTGLAGFGGLLYWLAQHTHDWQGTWQGRPIQVRVERKTSYLMVDNRVIASGPVGSWLSGEIAVGGGGLFGRQESPPRFARVRARAFLREGKVVFEVHAGDRCLTGESPSLHPRSVAARSALERCRAAGGPELQPTLDQRALLLDGLDHGLGHAGELRALGIDADRIEAELLAQLDRLMEPLERLPEGPGSPGSSGGRRSGPSCSPGSEPSGRSRRWSGRGGRAAGSSGPDSRGFGEAVPIRSRRSEGSGEAVRGAAETALIYLDDRT